MIKKLANFLKEYWIIVTAGVFMVSTLYGLYIYVGGPVPASINYVERRVEPIETLSVDTRIELLRQLNVDARLTIFEIESFVQQNQNGIYTQAQKELILKLQQEIADRELELNRYLEDMGMVKSR